MGNKSSSLAQVHDSLLEGKVSINNMRGDETIQSLDVLIEVIHNSLTHFEKLGSKEKKMLCSIATFLGNEVGLPVKQAQMPAVVRGCRIKMLTAIFHLMSEPSICKKEFEPCMLRGVSRCFELDDVDILSLSMSCLLVGLHHADDSYFALQLCLALEKHGVYIKMLQIISYTASVVRQEVQQQQQQENDLLAHAATIEPSTSTSTIPNYIFFPFLRLYDHLVWLNAAIRHFNLCTHQYTNATMTTMNNLYHSVLRFMSFHISDLGHLVRCSNSAVSYAASVLLISLLRDAQDKDKIHQTQVLDMRR